MGLKAFIQSDWQLATFGSCRRSVLETGMKTENNIPAGHKGILRRELPLRQLGFVSVSSPLISMPLTYRYRNKFSQSP